MVETTRLQEVSSLQLSSSSVKQTICPEMNGNTIAGREVEFAPPSIRFRKAVSASWCLFALVQNGLRGKKRTSGSLPAVLVVRLLSHQFYTHAR